MHSLNECLLSKFDDNSDSSEYIHSVSYFGRYLTVYIVIMNAHHLILIQIKCNGCDKSLQYF